MDCLEPLERFQQAHRVEWPLNGATLAILCWQVNVVPYNVLPGELVEDPFLELMQEFKFCCCCTTCGARGC